MEATALGALLIAWRADARNTLDSGTRLVESASQEADRHLVVGAALIAIVARFQHACRDLILATIEVISDHTGPEIRSLIKASLTLNLRTTRGNATPEAISADLDRLQIILRAALARHDPSPSPILDDLKAIHSVRNLIAHGESPGSKPFELEDLEVAIATLDRVLVVMAGELHERLNHLTPNDSEE